MTPTAKSTIALTNFFVTNLYRNEFAVKLGPLATPAHTCYKRPRHLFTDAVYYII